MLRYKIAADVDEKIVKKIRERLVRHLRIIAIFVLLDMLLSEKKIETEIKICFNFDSLFIFVIYILSIYLTLICYLYI